jgi:hypothetical protein
VDGIHPTRPYEHLDSLEHPHRALRAQPTHHGRLRSAGRVRTSRGRFELGPGYRGGITTKTREGALKAETINLKLRDKNPFGSPFRAGVLARKFMGVRFETADYACDLEGNFYDDAAAPGRLVSSGEGQRCKSKSGKLNGALATFAFLYTPTAGLAPSTFSLALVFQDGTVLTSSKPMVAFPSK